MCEDALHYADFVSDLEGLLLLGHLDVRLLGSVGCDQSVHLHWLEVVQLFASLLYLGLGGVGVNHEHQGVVVLNSPYGALAGDWELDDGEFVVGGELLIGDVLDLVSDGGDVGLGSSELDFGPDLLLADGLGSLLHILLGLLCLLYIVVSIMWLISYLTAASYFLIMSHQNATII
eukprot:TRINITY_DN28849_c0_g1_i1.p1 TRINITY_DN28849_c0_g1~~TRINITY_DN28849_c0_g1_i1.p1  ORF type:complete len:175 (+),score=12.09 TRINITY_DN28849_c0_g1_i1:130-654(+)